MPGFGEAPGHEDLDHRAPVISPAANVGDRLGHLGRQPAGLGDPFTFHPGGDELNVTPDTIGFSF